LTGAFGPRWYRTNEDEAVRILLIEDDPETAEYVVEGLRGEGHELEVSVDGRAALLRAASETWDLLIVDRMLPGLDGLALVRTLRASGIVAPSLFLTTMGGLDDRVTGLNAGADDYMVKPFAFPELIARVAALGRRPHALHRKLFCGLPIWKSTCSPVWSGVGATRWNCSHANFSYWNI
jgi:DNA-binding response OmpR family regulator